ncbi:CBN-NEX-2 protein [Aphelenchoides avenae]|nr:CBN-NEX-2 protein [Aphelenchus avenae]
MNSDLWGNFKELVTALLELPEEFDAREVHHAISHVQTKEPVLNEILATRCGERLAKMKEAYKRAYGTELVEDLCKHSEKNYHRFHVALTVGEHGDVDATKTEKCTRQLVEKMHTAHDKAFSFCEILADHSLTQLRAVFKKYEELTGNPIENYVEKEFDLKDVDSWLLTVIKLMRNKPAFFAEKLNEYLGGFEPSHRDVTRIIVSRSEEDLADIREAYQQMYRDSLESVLCEFAGSYGKALYKLVVGNNDARADTSNAVTAV